MISQSNNMGYWDETLRWGFDWMMKAHPSADVLYVGVGDGKVDNNYWVSATSWKHREYCIDPDLLFREATEPFLHLDHPTRLIEAVQGQMRQLVQLALLLRALYSIRL